MLYCFNQGELTARFNPLPGYWRKKADREQVNSWNFDLQRLCNDFNVPVSAVENYFVDWKTAVSDTKAYQEDEFKYGDCMQVFDLLVHFKILYGHIINSEKQARTFKLWTSYFVLQESVRITMDDLRKTKRYTTNYLRLSPEEIEVLLGISYYSFVQSATKNQTCFKCNSRDTEREDLDFYLSIPELLVKITGHCKNCGKRLDGAYGFFNLGKLRQILNN